jgi:hypothetical protein
MKVEVRYRGEAQYFRGVIKRAHLDGRSAGTFDVDYDDGEKEKFVAAALIRPLEHSGDVGSSAVAPAEEEGGDEDEVPARLSRKSNARARRIQDSDEDDEEEAEEEEDGDDTGRRPSRARAARPEARSSGRLAVARAAGGSRGGSGSRGGASTRGSRGEARAKRCRGSSSESEGEASDDGAASEEEARRRRRPSVRPTAALARAAARPMPRSARPARGARRRYDDDDDDNDDKDDDEGSEEDDDDEDGEAPPPPLGLRTRPVPHAAPAEGPRWPTWPEPSGGRGDVARVCGAVVAELLRWDDGANGGTFSSPVDLRAAEGYLEVVPQPMDLGTMQSKVLGGLM